MTVTWRKIQAASKICLWFSSATTAWALVSYASFHGIVRPPDFIQLPIMLSGGLALIGGSFAVVYLLVGARRPTSVVLVIMAAGANLWYFCDFARSLIGGTRASYLAIFGSLFR